MISKYLGGMGMGNYILNINTKTIHDGDSTCRALKRTKPSNLKHFEKYEDAVNYFESETVKGVPCGICLKEFEK